MLLINTIKNNKDNNNNNKLFLAKAINQIYKRDKFTEEILEAL